MAEQMAKPIRPSPPSTAAPMDPGASKSGPSALDRGKLVELKVGPILRLREFTEFGRIDMP